MDLDTPCYRFHRYRLLPAQRQLLDGEQAAKLGSRAFDMLVVLVERRDRVVTKHELMELVWPRLVVEENNLQVQVLALRKLLGHGAIATIPGRGYRFTLPVQADRQAATVPLPASTVPAAPPPAPLLGREEEVQTLRRLLDAHALVTVAGAGGIGKTRLAQSVARQRGAGGGGHAGDGSPDDVCWVDLSGLQDSGFLPAAVAQALGLSLERGADVTATVLQSLQGRCALLVLDNAEHLLDAVGPFVALVRGQAQGMRLLITSQEVLRVADEQVFRPGPLALPKHDDLLSAQASGAVALFVARARLADPRFELGEHNRAAVTEICRRLDGIPLAIELAAARVGLLGVDGLRARLDERFQLLTAGARAVMRRHQTLRAALEWSHGLLGAAEQRVLHRLAVLVGGFTLEAAQDVAEDEALDAWDVIDVLGALVDKSLVVAEGQALPRYHLLETTRLYALERLAESAATETTLARHAHHFVALAERVDAEISAHGQGAAALALLDAERDNLLHALRWCAGSDHVEAARLGLRLAAALRYYWSSRGLLAFGAAQLLRALEHSKAPFDALHAQALATAAQLHAWIGQDSMAEQLARSLRDEALAAGLDEGALRASMQLGHLAADRGAWDDATRDFDAVRARAEALGLARLQAAALNGLVVVASSRGDFDHMLRIGDELLALQRRLGQSYNLCTSLLNLAVGALEAGQPKRLRQLVLEAAPLVPGTDSRVLDLLWLALATPALVDHAPWPLVLRLYRVCQRHERELEIGRQEPLDRHRERHLATARATLAPEAFDEARAAGDKLDMASARALALVALQP